MVTNKKNPAIKKTPRTRRRKKITRDSPGVSQAGDRRRIISTTPIETDTKTLQPFQEGPHGEWGKNAAAAAVAVSLVTRMAPPFERYQAKTNETRGQARYNSSDRYQRIYEKYNAPREREIIYQGHQQLSESLTGKGFNARSLHLSGLDPIDESKCYFYPASTTVHSSSVTAANDGNRERFIRKLKLCAVIYSFKDPMADRREKDRKRQTLLGLLDYVHTPAGQQIFTTESVMNDVKRMVSSNVCRTLPPATDGFEPETDSPVLAPAWPHLQVVYEFLLRFLVSSEVTATAAQNFVDQHFCVQLLELFDSEDPRERDYLKIILHRIYGKFMSHRSFIRREISNVFCRFVYETKQHNGIGELLEILGSIINGFAIPLKKEHLQFLVRALIPLHKPKCVALYHQQLSYCMIQYVEQDAATVITPMLTGFLKYWPWNSSGKQVLFLNELEEIVEILGAEQLAQVSDLLVPHIARCLEFDHFQVVERALFLWNSEQLVNAGWLSRQYAPAVLPSIYGPLYKNTRRQWNAEVKKLAQHVLQIYRNYDEVLYARCNDKYLRDEQEATQQRNVWEDRWRVIEQHTASTNVVRTGTTGTAASVNLKRMNSPQESVSLSTATATATAGGGTAGTIFPSIQHRMEDINIQSNNNSNDSKVNRHEEQIERLRLSNNNNNNKSANLKKPPPSHSSTSASASASDSTSVLSRSSASVPVPVSVSTSTSSVVNLGNDKENTRTQKKSNKKKKKRKNSSRSNTNDSSESKRKKVKVFFRSLLCPVFLGSKKRDREESEDERTEDAILENNNSIPLNKKLKLNDASSGENGDTDMGRDNDGDDGVDGSLNTNRTTPSPICLSPHHTLALDNDNGYDNRTAATTTTTTTNTSPMSKAKLSSTIAEANRNSDASSLREGNTKNLTATTTESPPSTTKVTASTATKLATDSATTAAITGSGVDAGDDVDAGEDNGDVDGSTNSGGGPTSPDGDSDFVHQSENDGLGDDGTNHDGGVDTNQKMPPSPPVTNHASISTATGARDRAVTPVAGATSTTETLRTDISAEVASSNVNDNEFMNFPTDGNDVAEDEGCMDTHVSDFGDTNDEENNSHNNNKNNGSVGHHTDGDDDDDDNDMVSGQNSLTNDGGNNATNSHQGTVSPTRSRNRASVATASTSAPASKNNSSENIENQTSVPTIEPRGFIGIATNKNDSHEGVEINRTQPTNKDLLSSVPDVKSNPDGNHDASNSPSSSSLKNNNNAASVSSATALPVLYLGKYKVPQDGRTKKAMDKWKKRQRAKHKKEMVLNDSTEWAKVTRNEKPKEARKKQDDDKENIVNNNQRKIQSSSNNHLSQLTSKNNQYFQNNPNDNDNRTDSHRGSAPAPGSALAPGGRNAVIDNANNCASIVTSRKRPHGNSGDSASRTNDYPKKRCSWTSYASAVHGKHVEYIANDDGVGDDGPSNDVLKINNDVEDDTNNSTNQNHGHGHGKIDRNNVEPVDRGGNGNIDDESNSNEITNEFEFDTVDEIDDVVDNDDAGNNTNNVIDDNANANANDNDNEVISVNDNVTNNENHKEVPFAPKNVVPKTPQQAHIEQRNNTGSDGNPKQGECFCDSRECKEISLQLDKASDLSEVAKIVADVTEPAKIAEQEANEVARLGNLKADEKEESEKITGKHGSYKADFDNHEWPSGHGVYCEDKARDGNPGCFQSTGMYKDGHETDLCVVNYNDNFESTYCGMMREGNRHGYGALTYKENNKEYRHEGSWENGRRHGFVLFIDGSSRSFGLYKNNEAVGTHVTWDSNSENCCGDNDGDNNTDGSDGGNDVTSNNNITNKNKDENKVYTASCRKKGGGYTRLRGADLRAHIEQQNKKGIGAKATTDRSGKCVDRVLKLIFEYYMIKDKKFPFYEIKSNNIDGPQTRSKKSDWCVEYCELDDRLAKELEGGRTADGWTELEFWRNFIKQWGLEARDISPWCFGESSVTTLSRREPIFIVVELAVQPEYGGPKVENKDIGPDYIMTHAMVLLPDSKHGTSTIIDPDGMEYTLSREEVQFFTDSKHTDRNAKKEAKKIFNHYLGIEFSYKINSSFLIKDTRKEE